MEFTSFIIVFSHQLNHKDAIMPLDALSVIAGAILVFTFCLFCWACYEFYTAVPPTINQKWLFRVVFIMFKVNRFIVSEIKI